MLLRRCSSCIDGRVGGRSRSLSGSSLPPRPSALRLSPSTALPPAVPLPAPIRPGGGASPSCTSAHRWSRLRGWHYPVRGVGVRFWRGSCLFPSQHIWSPGGGTRSRERRSLWSLTCPGTELAGGRTWPRISRGSSHWERCIRHQRSTSIGWNVRIRSLSGYADGGIVSRGCRKPPNTCSGISRSELLTIVCNR